MIPSRRRRAAEAAEQFDQLLAGTIGLQDLNVPLVDYYHLGFFDGQASLAIDLTRRKAPLTAITGAHSTAILEPTHSLQ